MSGHCSLVGPRIRDWGFQFLSCVLGFVVETTPYLTQSDNVHAFVYNAMEIKLVMPFFNPQ
jgi:hypothetical protein